MKATSLHVGIVGHRPRRLAHADPLTLRQVLLGILRVVKDEALHPRGESGPAGLTAISPLAEGADRLFAELALEEGWDLLCVMPFAQTEYERDFEGAEALEPESLRRFRELLSGFARAGRLGVVELPGDRRDTERAYRAAGARVVESSDLLVAVWDGEQRGSPAGTEAAMALARESGVPTAWVHAVAPHEWRLFDVAGDAASEDDEVCCDSLRRVVRRVLASGVRKDGQ